MTYVNVFFKVSVAFFMKPHNKYIFLLKCLILMALSMHLTFCIKNKCVIS